MAILPRPAVMLDILEEHFEELDFLWEQREGVIFAPDWTLKELAELEERAEAHLDGLRLGAGHSVDLARPGLAGKERGLATAAAFTLMAMSSPELEGEVLLALSQASTPEARDGIRIALRHSDVSRLADSLVKLASAGEPVVRAAAADVMAFHRMAPPPRLLDLLGIPDPEVRRLLCGAIGRFGGPWSIDPLETALRGDDRAIAEAALETSARLGVPDLAGICRKAATKSPSPSPEALRFLGVLGGVNDLPLLESCLGRPDFAGAALQGIGALGSARAIPALLQTMENPLMARASGAAFVRITGARNIEADKPLPPPPDLPEDEVDFRDNTNPPDPGRAKAWWEKEKGRFAPEGRWQAGRDVAKEPLGEAFKELPLACRRDIYLGVRARDPFNTPDLELERKAVRQSGAITTGAPHR